MPPSQAWGDPKSVVDLIEIAEAGMGGEFAFPNWPKTVTDKECEAVSYT